MPGLSLSQTSETTITYLINILSSILSNSTYINNTVNSTVDISLQNTCNNTIKTIFQEFEDNGYSKEQIKDMLHIKDAKENRLLNDINYDEQYQAALNFVNSGNKYSIFDNNEFENAVNEIHSSSWNREDVGRDMENWLNELSS
jgi:hypothetical protein